MPIALPLTLDLDQHFGDWRDDLARDGFVILRGVVPPERAEAYRQKAFDWIEKAGLGFDRNDPNTWKQDCMPVMKKGGMVRPQRSRCSCPSFTTRSGKKPSCGNFASKPVAEPDDY